MSRALSRASGSRSRHRRAHHGLDRPSHPASIANYPRFHVIDVLFLVLSGIATTGSSWLFFYAALLGWSGQRGRPSRWLSILVTIAFATFVLKEKLSRRALLGLILIVAGTLVMLF